MSKTRIITIANRKGGVGKSTTACTLAVELSNRKKRVLLIDLDSQGNCEQLLGLQNYDPEKDYYINSNLFGLYEDEKKENNHITKRNNLDIIVGGDDIIKLEREINNEPFRREEILRLKLSNHFDLNKDYDFIILDTSPSFSILNFNALFMSHEVIIPVTLEKMPIDAIETIEEEVKKAFSFNNTTTITTILPTKFDSRISFQRQQLDIIKNKYEDIYTIATAIPTSSKINESVYFGEPIVSYENGKCRGSQEYKQLADLLED